MARKTPTSAYQTALRELEAAKRRVEELADVVSEVAGKLRWSALRFVVNGAGVEFPPSNDSGENVFTFDANRWPSAHELAETLANYQQARAAVDRAWQAVAPRDADGPRP